MKLNNTAGADSHTAEYLADQIIKVVKDVGPMKIKGICTDNAANMKKAWDLIQEQYPHIQSYGCAAHTLNLVFSDILKFKSAAALIKDCTLVVKTIKNSQKLSALLSKDSTTSLKLPVKTR